MLPLLRKISRMTSSNTLGSVIPALRAICSAAARCAGVNVAAVMIFLGKVRSVKVLVSCPEA